MGPETLRTAKDQTDILVREKDRETFTVRDNGEYKIPPRKGQEFFQGL